MSLDVQVWALGVGGDPDVMLPDVGDYSITPIAGDVGSVSIDYPRDGLRFAALRALVDEDRPVELEIRTDGTSANAVGALLYTASGDDIKPGAVWTFTGTTLEGVLRRAVTPYNDDPGQGGTPNGESTFSATAGVVMRTLMQRAQTRGALLDVSFASFTNTLDSNGAAWVSTAAISLAPGRDYADILATTLHANELCEWEVRRAGTGYELRLYNPGTRGVDRTLPGPGQVTLEHGRDLEDAPVKHDLTNVRTTITASGKDGLVTTASNATAAARLGYRVEGYTSFGDGADPGTLAAAAQLAATAAGDGESEHSHGLILESEGHPLPGRDFALSDWVLRAVNGVTARRRVVRYSLTRSGREVRAAVTLGDIINARAVRVQRAIEALTNGSTVVGAPAPPPDVDDGKAPAAPAGVVATSTAYYDGGTPLAQVSAGWNAVVTNADGTAIGDLDHYEVEYRYTAGQGLPEAWQAAGTTPDPGLDWSPLIQGKGVGVRVRAVDRYARPSAWSTEYLLVTASDAVAAPGPAAPRAAAVFGAV
ncbi:MAG: hypothetical protein L0H84_05590, partial [Pseudonocardia sp.]|nr:hypothetical protein [Pseudonocardia sp.]